MYSPLDQTPPEDNSPLTLPTTPNIPMSPETASPLAGKVSWAFDKPYNDVYDALIRGQEDPLRANLAAEESSNQLSNIGDIIRKARSYITPTALTQLTAPKDPRDIFEKKFAEKSINSLTDYKEDDVDEKPTAILDAAREDPAGLAEDTAAGKSIAYRRQLLETGLQDAQDTYKHQGYFSWGLDLAKQLTQIYPEAKLRGNIPGVGAFEGGLLGENLEKQRVGLLSIPDDEEFKNTYLNILNKLKQDNPSMAVAFAQAMYGQSLSDRYINNAMTAIGALDIKSGFLIGKGIAGRVAARRALTDIINRGADEAAKGLDAVAPSIATAEASGHVGDAALQQTVNRILDQEATRITPERTALEGLMSIMKQGKNLALDNTPERVRAVITGMRKTLEFNAASKDPAIIEEMKVLQTHLDEFTKDNELAAKHPEVAREIFARLSEQYDNTTGAFIEARLNLQNVLRIGNALANRKVLEQVWKEIKGRTQGLSDNVIDQTIPKFNPITQNHEVTTIFGRNSAELFNNDAEAIGTVEKHGLRVTMIDGVPVEGVKPGESGVSIGSVGGKYYAAISRPINEIEHYIRDAVVETEESKAGNHGILNSWGLGWGRTPDEVLPQLENMNRKIAIYGPAALRDVLERYIASKVDLARARLRGKNLFEVFNNLGKGSQFQRMLDHLQRAINPETGKPGIEFKTPQEVYSFYMTNYGRMPDPIEYEAYFAAKHGMDMDLSFRNMMVVKNIARLGGEEHRISVYNGRAPEGRDKSKWFVGMTVKPEGELLPAIPEGTTNPKIDRKLTDPGLNVQYKEVEFGGKKYTAAFSGGRKADVRLGIPNDAPIAHVGDNTGELNITSAQSFAQSRVGKDIIPKLQTGEYKLIKLYNVHQNDLNGFNGIGNERIQYVITRNHEVRPVSFQQIPRQPGFHIQYDHPFYMKQADIRKSIVGPDEYHWYEGDNTAFLLQNRLMGEDLAKVMNEVRGHIAGGREAEAEAAAAKLPIGYKELRSWFSESRGPGGEIIRPRFNLTEDFKVIPKNTTIMDFDRTLADKYKLYNFRDGTRTGSPARQFQIEFSGQRDARDVMEISNKGTRYNPEYSYDPAQPMDPITSMNRALTNITNSVFMDDVKISSMENWLRRHKDVLEVEGNADLMSAPFYHFNTAKVSKGQPKRIQSQIEAERWMIKQFNGTPSVWDTTLASIQDKLMDDIYGAGGWNTKYAAATVGKWGVALIKDGPSYLRYMAFKAGLGMFSIPQFFTQANTIVSIMGMAGWGKAAQGTSAAMMHTWSRFNRDPSILRTMDKKLQAFGWKPGEFLEANNAIKGTGFDYVSNETNSMFGYTKTDSITKNAGRSIMDVGDIPFKEGERLGRYASWYTAFKEWRDANPVAKFNDLARAKVLQRADDLSGNMTLASKSGLQTGVLSFPTQFLGYTMRMTELALGHRLTWQQKARLFGTYWTMYGLPVALGITGTSTFGNMWKESVAKSGYSPNEAGISQMVNEGLPAAFLQLVTGNTYNVGEKFGNPGLADIREFLSKDKTTMENVMGASGTLLEGLANADGYWKWLTTFAKGEDNAYGLTSADAIKPFQAISSVNNLWRTEAAVNIGKYMTKNENVLKDNTGVMNAIFMGVTGLQPKDVDTQTLQRMKDQREEKQKEGLNSFIRNTHRAMDAIKNKDPQLANVFFNNAKMDLIISGYPEEKRLKAWEAAVQNRTLPERELWNYWLENVPPEERVESAKIYDNIIRNTK
jgi:hypothetical protein